MQPDLFDTPRPVEHHASGNGRGLGPGRFREHIGRDALRLAIGALIATLLLVFVFERGTLAARASSRQHAQDEARRAVAAIDEEIGPIVPTLTAIADSVGSGAIPRESLLDRLRTLAEISPQLAGLGVAFAPTEYDPGLQLYAPYFVRRSERLELVQLDSLYDYTDPDYQWYRRPLEEGAVWTEPYRSELTPGQLVDFAVPFHASDSERRVGVLHATVSLRNMDALVEQLDLGEDGYAFLVSTGGALMSHPLLSADDVTVADSVENPRLGNVRALAVSLREKQGGTVDDVVDPATDSPSRMVLERVPSTGWTVGVVLLDDETAIHTPQFRHLKMQLLLAVLLTVLFFAVSMLARSRLAAESALWAAVFLFSTLCTLGITAVWYMSYREPAQSPYDVVFASDATLRTFRIERTRQALRQNSELPIYIPTGVFVQSLEFQTANNVSFTGYVWQRYPKDLPAEISRGFTLPEAVDAEITEAYRRTEGDDVVIGWLVRAELREAFDYAHYPLDHQAVWLRFWHPDIDRNVILVPDFASYQLIHPHLRPGIEEDFVLPGWKIDKTYFAYRRNQYNATFGVERPGGQHDLPELYFHVAMTREILNPFFSHLLPVTVAALMVFALLLMIGPFKEFSAMEVLATAAALFFVIILAQLDLRGKLGSEHILYIEYFYFVMYGAILLVSLNAIMIGLETHGRVIGYRNNLIAKLSFWPAIQATLLAVTLWIFY